MLLSANSSSSYIRKTYKCKQSQRIDWLGTQNITTARITFTKRGTEIDNKIKVSTIGKKAIAETFI